MIMIRVYENEEFLPSYIETSLKNLGKVLYKILNQTNFGDISVSVLWK